MKTQYLMTAALGTLLVVLGQANAGEEDLSKDQVPFVRFDTASTLSGQSYIDEKRQRNICLVIRV